MIGCWWSWLPWRSLACMSSNSTRLSTSWTGSLERKRAFENLKKQLLLLLLLLFLLLFHVDSSGLLLDIRVAFFSTGQFEGYWPQKRRDKIHRQTRKQTCHDSNTRRAFSPFCVQGSKVVLSKVPLKRGWKQHRDVGDQYALGLCQAPRRRCVWVVCDRILWWVYMYGRLLWRWGKRSCSFFHVSHYI